MRPSHLRLRGSGGGLGTTPRSLITLDRVCGHRVGSAGSETGRRTLTSWRSGRMGQLPLVKRGLGASASCAEDGASGPTASRWDLLREVPRAGWGGSRLAQQQQVSQRSAWPSHAAPVPGASDRCRAGAILRNHGGSATSPDAQASDASASPDASAFVLVESLILAQDQRWRRA
jgi:hypothetical protein